MNESGKCSFFMCDCSQYKQKQGSNKDVCECEHIKSYHKVKGSRKTRSNNNYWNNNLNSSTSASSSKSSSTKDNNNTKNLIKNISDNNSIELFFQERRDMFIDNNIFKKVSSFGYQSLGELLEYYEEQDWDEVKTSKRDFKVFNKEIKKLRSGLKINNQDDTYNSENNNHNNAYKDSLFYLEQAKWIESNEAAIPKIDNNTVISVLKNQIDDLNGCDEFKIALLKEKIKKEYRWVYREISSIDDLQTLFDLLEYYIEKDDLNIYNYFKKPLNKNQSILEYLNIKLDLIKELNNNNNIDTRLYMLLLHNIIPKSFMDQYFKIQRKDGKKNMTPDKVATEFLKVQDKYLQQFRKNNNHKNNFKNKNKKKKNNNNDNKNNNKKEELSRTLYIPTKNQNQEEHFKKVSELNPSQIKKTNNGICAQFKSIEEKDKAMEKIKLYNANVIQSKFANFNLEIDKLDEENVVGGKIEDVLFFQKPDYGLFSVLVDSGSSNNLISEDFATRIGASVKKLPDGHPRKINTGKEGTQLFIVGKTCFKFNTTQLRDLDAEFLVVRDLNASYDAFIGKDFCAENDVKISPGKEVIIRNKHHPFTFECMNDLLRKFYHLFKDSGPTVNGFKMRINKLNNSPIFNKIRTIAIHFHERVRQLIEEYVRIGILEPTNEIENENPLVIVQKSDGIRIRITNDFRKLNKAIENVVNSIPDIKKIFYQLKGSRYYTKLDFKDAYFQFDLEPSSRKYTAFSTPWGRFQYKVVPQGVKTSPGFFNNAIRVIFATIENVYKYFDDILISNTHLLGHFENLNEVFQTSEDNNLRFGWVGSQICLPKVDFTGFVLDGDSIGIPEERIKALKNIKIPNNKDELASVLATLNYFRQYSVTASVSLAPLFDKLSKHVRWKKLTEEEEKIITDFIDQITNDPNVIKTPRVGEPFILRTDAGKRGCAGILEQSHGIIAVDGFKFNATQATYDAPKKELFSIYRLLKKFEYILRGAKVTILCDCQPVVRILNHITQNLDPIRLKWANYISGFDVNVEHVSRSEVAIADQFGRIIENDEESHVIKYLRERPTENNLRKALVQLHDCKGHQSISNLITILNSIDIENKLKIITNYVHTCRGCQLTRRKCKRVSSDNKLPSKPFEQIACDVLTPERGNDILLVVDLFSRFPVAKYMKKSIESSDVIKFLDKTFSVFGYPKMITSDRATYFFSDQVKQYYQDNNIEIKNVDSHHQSSNGNAEIIVKKVLDQARKQFIENIDKRSLDKLLFNIRNAKNSITRLSPSEMLFGRPTNAVGSSIDNEKLNQVVTKTNKSRDKRRAKDAEHIRNFQIGDDVVIFQHVRGKTAPKWKGPFKVIDKVGNVGYIIDINGKNSYKHIDNLRKYNVDPEREIEQTSETKQEKELEILDDWFDYNEHEHWYYVNQDNEEDWFLEDQIHNEVLDEYHKNKLIQEKNFREKIKQVVTDDDDTILSNILQAIEDSEIFSYTIEQITNQPKYKKIIKQPRNLKSMFNFCKRKFHNYEKIFYCLDSIIDARRYHVPEKEFGVKLKQLHDKVVKIINGHLKQKQQ